MDWKRESRRAASQVTRSGPYKKIFYGGHIEDLVHLTRVLNVDDLLRRIIATCGSVTLTRMQISYQDGNVVLTGGRLRATTGTHKARSAR